MNLWQRMNSKEDPRVYENKDGHLVRSLKVKDFLALGVGTIVSASIFTLPGEVAQHNQAGKPHDGGGNTQTLFHSQ